MRALVYHGPGQKAWEEVPDPEILDDGDVIVRVDATTICGTDLHILKGDVPAVHKGRILGHEAVGTVWEAGDGVRRLCPGDRVLVSCISALRILPVLPRGPLRAVPGGRRLGPRPQGRRHPGRVRPRAVRGQLHVPDSRRRERRRSPHAGRHPADRLRGRRAGRRRASRAMSSPSSATGPVGLSAITGARLYSPSHIVAIDLSDARLEAAKQFGADVTVNNSREDPLSRHQGPDRAAGRGRVHRGRRRPASFELAVKLARPGGRIANIGVHGEPSRCTWKSSGSGTSRSPPAWWTPPPRRP